MYSDTTMALIFCLFAALHMWQFTSINYVSANLEGENIVGGDYAIENQFKYQVSLQINRTSSCGGGIIGDWHILTAAHCVVDRFGNIIIGDYKVVAGSIDLTVVQGVSISVGKAYVLKNYKSSVSDLNDIAVLKLKRRLKLNKRSFLKKLDLPTSDELIDYTGQRAVIAGYGYTWVKSFFNWAQLDGDTDYKLKYANVNIISYDDCKRKNLFLTIDRTKQICGQAVQRNPNNPEGICSTDSGSPLVINNMVIGVFHSSPAGCQENEANAFYTRVSTFLPFITQAIEDKPSSSIQVFPIG